MTGQFESPDPADESNPTIELFDALVQGVTPETPALLSVERWNPTTLITPTVPPELTTLAPGSMDAYTGVLELYDIARVPLTGNAGTAPGSFFDHDVSVMALLRPQDPFGGVIPEGQALGARLEYIVWGLVEGDLSICMPNGETYPPEPEVELLDDRAIAELMRSSAGDPPGDFDDYGAGNFDTDALMSDDDIGYYDDQHAPQDYSEY